MDVLTYKMLFHPTECKSQICASSTNSCLDSIWAQGSILNHHITQRRRALIEARLHLALHIAAGEAVGVTNQNIPTITLQHPTNKIIIIPKTALRGIRLITVTVHMMAPKIPPRNIIMAGQIIIASIRVPAETTATKAPTVASRVQAHLHTTMELPIGEERVISTIRNGQHVVLVDTTALE